MDIDHQADLYSVDMILYEMLTGKMAVGIPVMPSRIHPSIPAKVDELISKLLTQSPEDRYPDAESFRKKAK